MVIKVRGQITCIHVLMSCSSELCYSEMCYWAARPHTDRHSSNTKSSCDYKDGVDEQLNVFIDQSLTPSWWRSSSVSLSNEESLKLHSLRSTITTWSNSWSFLADIKGRGN